MATKCALRIDFLRLEKVIFTPLKSVKRESVLQKCRSAKATDRLKDLRQTPNTFREDTLVRSEISEYNPPSVLRFEKEFLAIRR